MKATRSSQPPPRPLQRAGKGSPTVGTLLASSLEEGWRRYQTELKRCRKKFSEATVHDLRVATRRLISTLDLLQQLHPDQRLRRTRRKINTHLKAFGPLRDVQVQLLAVEPMLRVFPELQDFYDYLGKRERKLVKRLGAEVKAIKNGRLAKVIRATAEHWQAVPKTPAVQRERRRAAIAAVDAAFSNVVEHKIALDPIDPATIHRMRVAFKKFRYSVEVLAPLLPKASSRQLKAMKAFQDRMGDIQDSTVLLASIHRFARKKRGGGDTTLSAVYQELTRNRTALVEAFLPSADLVSSFGKVLS